MGRDLTPVRSTMQARPTTVRDSISLIQAEIQEAVETIVRKRVVGWKSVHFENFPAPQIHYDEDGKTVTISLEFKARDLRIPVQEVDLRPKLLKIEFNNR